MELQRLFWQRQHGAQALLFSSEVNLFCRKADGGLVLAASRSASPSPQLSRRPRCAPVASVFVHVTAYACVRVCYNSVAPLWQIYTSLCTFNNSISGLVSPPQLLVSLWNRAKCHQDKSISLLVETHTHTHTGALFRCPTFT